MDTEHTPASHGPGRQTQWLPIPSRAISVVEHPAIIKNVDKGITSLGGPVKLSKVSRDESSAYRIGILTIRLGPTIETGNHRQCRGRR